MPDNDILRPSSTVTAGSWTPTGGATLQAVTSDDSDATYAAREGSGVMELAFPSHTPAALHERHGITLSLRHSREAGAVQQVLVTAQPQGGSGLAQSTLVYSPDTTVRLGAGSTARGIPAAGAVVFTFRAGVNTGITVESRIHEVYLNVDNRAQPTFDEDVVDAAGVSRDGGTITDTPRATLQYNNLNYDGLNPRSWSLRVLTSDGFAAFERSGPGAPPTPIVTDPLPNGAYTAELQVFSTIRYDDPFGSTVETVSWTQNFTPPAPPDVTVTANGCPGVSPNVEVCWATPTPGAVEFDNIDQVAIEIERTDCHGTRTVYTAADAPDGCFCDRFVGLSDAPVDCDQSEQAFVALGIPVRTPHTGALVIDDNIRIRIRAALVRWSDTFDEQTLASARHGGNSWQLRISQFTGRLQFVWWLGGVAQVETADADLPFGEYEPGWVEVLRSGTSVTFGYSEDDTDDPDAATFTQLGTVQATSAGAIDAAATQITLGTQAATGGEVMAGTIRSFALYDGAVKVADPIFSESPWKVGDDAGTVRDDALGNPWTIGTGDSFIGAGVCLATYKARYWGLVDTVLVSTDWSGWDVVYVENPTPGNDWLHGLTGGDLTLCDSRDYSRTWPFGAFQPIDGGIPTVITAAPGGRNYTLQMTVQTEAELVALEEVLAQPLVFYQPVGAADLWLSPAPELAVLVTKIKRYRQVVASFVAVNPQPATDPESFFD